MAIDDGIALLPVTVFVDHAVYMGHTLVIATDAPSGREHDRIDDGELVLGVLWMPQMRAFRQDPRFQALATRLKLMDYWKQYGPPDDCALLSEQLECR